jgi:hypothetical protein
MVICNSLLLLKSLPINIINCRKDYTPLIIFTNLANIFAYMTIIVKSMYNFVNCLQFKIRYEKVERPAPVGSALVLFIHNHLILRKWCYTRLQHDLPLDPIISPLADKPTKNGFTYKASQEVDNITPIIT